MCACFRKQVHFDSVNWPTGTTTCSGSKNQLWVLLYVLKDNKTEGRCSNAFHPRWEKLQNPAVFMTSWRCSHSLKHKRTYPNCRLSPAGWENRLPEGISPTSFPHSSTSAAFLFILLLEPNSLHPTHLLGYWLITWHFWSFFDPSPQHTHTIDIIISCGPL